MLGGDLPGESLAVALRLGGVSPPALAIADAPAQRRPDGGGEPDAAEDEVHRVAQDDGQHHATDDRQRARRAARRRSAADAPARRQVARSVTAPSRAGCRGGRCRVNRHGSSRRGARAAGVRRPSAAERDASLPKRRRLGSDRARTESSGSAPTQGTRPASCTSVDAVELRRRAHVEHRMVQLGEGVVEADGARRRSPDEVASGRQRDDRSGRRTGLDGDHEVVSVGAVIGTRRRPSVRRGRRRGPVGR